MSSLRVFIVFVLACPFSVQAILGPGSRTKLGKKLPTLQIGFRSLNLNCQGRISCVRSSSVRVGAHTGPACLMLGRAGLMRCKMRCFTAALLHDTYGSHLIGRRYINLFPPSTSNFLKPVSISSNNRYCCQIVTSQWAMHWDSISINRLNIIIKKKSV